MLVYGLADIKMRMLRIDELKKIMGFPENYILVGTQSDQKKFIGNAVEVNMARVLCEAICKEIIRKRKLRKMVSEVHNMDCMEYMRNIPDKFFELAVVDPPYGINAPNMSMGSNMNRRHGGYNGESTAQRLKRKRFNQGAGKLKNRALNTMQCDWDCHPPSKEYFEELFRVSRNQVIWGGNYFSLPPTRGILCWDKMQPWKNFSQLSLLGLLLIVRHLSFIFQVAEVTIKNQKSILHRNLSNFINGFLKNLLNLVTKYWTRTSAVEVPESQLIGWGSISMEPK